MSWEFGVRVGVGKSGQNHDFVCTAWQRGNCRQATHQVQANTMICFALDSRVSLS